MHSLSFWKASKASARVRSGRSFIQASNACSYARSMDPYLRCRRGKVVVPKCVAVGSTAFFGRLALRSCSRVKAPGAIFSVPAVRREGEGGSAELGGWGWVLSLELESMIFTWQGLISGLTDGSYRTC